MASSPAHPERPAGVAGRTWPRKKPREDAEEDRNGSRTRRTMERSIPELCSERRKGARRERAPFGLVEGTTPEDQNPQNSAGK